RLVDVLVDGPLLGFRAAPRVLAAQYALVGAELESWIEQGNYERILGGGCTRRGPEAEQRPIDKDIDEARDHYMKEAKAVVNDVVDTAKRAAQAFAEALKKK